MLIYYLKEKKMSVAQKIKELNSGFAAALEYADSIAVEADQDWENEVTIFSFEDGSKLKASYPDLTVV